MVPARRAPSSTSKWHTDQGGVTFLIQGGQYKMKRLTSTSHVIYLYPAGHMVCRWCNCMHACSGNTEYTLPYGSLSSFNTIRVFLVRFGRNTGLLIVLCFELGLIVTEQFGCLSVRRFELLAWSENEGLKGKKHPFLPLHCSFSYLSQLPFYAATPPPSLSQLRSENLTGRNQGLFTF